VSQAEPAQPESVRGIDAAFLHNETRSTPWQIFGVLLFDPSTADHGFDRDVVARVIADRLDQIDAFRRRVVDVPGALSLPHWVVDDEVDLEHHVRAMELPNGSGVGALADAIGSLAVGPLPRDRPLWQMHVVSDAGEGRAAILAKVHHSIMDGAAAVGILGALFDLEARPPPTAAAIDSEPSEREPEPQVLDTGSIVRRLARMPAAAVRTALHVPSAGIGFVRALRDAGRYVTLPLTGPRTRFNGSITAKRAVALGTLPLADVREVADAFDLKINDVLMTVCAGALRSWLHDAAELPKRPLVAAVPVAIPEQEHRSGNRVSVLFASLPTHLEDPMARIEFVQRGMRDAKATHEDVDPQTLGTIAESLPWNVVGLLFRAYSDLGLANRLPPAVNLVVSNVPGPPVPVFCGGAKLVGLYPLGPIFDGAGLNVTFASCLDEVNVGVVTCPDVAPPLDGLLPAFRSALQELLSIARAHAKT
jgi:diacylglycerol O-acyltransferase / wax synthase